MKDYGSIKSLLHFEESMTDEVSSEKWEASGDARLEEKVQDAWGELIRAKFGEGYMYFPGNDEGYVYCRNDSGLFNLSKDKDYELEAFVFFNGYRMDGGIESGATGKIFSIGDLELIIDDSGKFGLNTPTRSYVAYLSSSVTVGHKWHHVLLRVREEHVNVYLDGEEIIAGWIMVDVKPAIVKLGGYRGGMDEFVFRTSAGIDAPQIPTAAYDGVEVSEPAAEGGLIKFFGVIQLRGGTAEALRAANPVLKRREVMCEVDTGRIKVGDGVHMWTDLLYVGGGLVLPSGDDGVYVVKNGTWVKAEVVEAPASWQPSIAESDELVLTLDEDMTPYQLSGEQV